MNGYKRKAALLDDNGCSRSRVSTQPGQPGQSVWPSLTAFIYLKYNTIYYYTIAIYIRLYIFDGYWYLLVTMFVSGPPMKYDAHPCSSSHEIYQPLYCRVLQTPIL